MGMSCNVWEFHRDLSNGLAATNAMAEIQGIAPGSPEWLALQDQSDAAVLAVDALERQIAVTPMCALGDVLQKLELAIGHGETSGFSEKNSVGMSLMKSAANDLKRLLAKE